MARNIADEKRVWSNSIENEVEEMAEAEAEEEEEEEALSLCDLPLSVESESRKEEAQGQRTLQNQEDFDFGSWVDQATKESEMCAADEVFFQGQILPLRHSISSESGMPMFRNNTRHLSRCISLSESMDHRYSGGFRSNSSRSSSIRSHNSSSSSSGSSTTTTTATTPPYKSRVLNQLNSKPSPSPQIRTSFIRNQSNPITQKSTMWSLFRVGLVQAPEIAFQDLKIRNNASNAKKHPGSRSRNSTSSSSSSFSFSNDTMETRNDRERTTDQKMKINKKKQGFFLDINGKFFGGCKCSINAVETVPTRIVVIKNSNSNLKAKERDQAWKKTKQQQQQQHPQAKQAVLTRHRTFEWLKQLSLEGVPIRE